MPWCSKEKKKERPIFGESLLILLSLPLPRRLYHDGSREGKAVRFQRFRMRTLRLWEIVRCTKSNAFICLGGQNLNGLEVTALNLFHPTASPLFITTKPTGGEREG
jgi:hypothetical protein